MSIEKPCEFCGALFTAAAPSLLARKRFCSRSCRSSALWATTGPTMKEAYRVKQAGNLAGAQLTCAQCGKHFSVRPSRRETAKAGTATALLPPP